MKKLILCLVACVTMMGAPLQAQNIAGTWQGTLKVQRDLRIVLVIKKDDVKLSGTMYSIDQGAMPIKVSSIALDGSNFKFTEPAPALTDAMESQLGLKLSTEKTAVEVIAIDHVEKPSPN